MLFAISTDLAETTQARFAGLLLVRAGRSTSATWSPVLSSGGDTACNGVGWKRGTETN